MAVKTTKLTATHGGNTFTRRTHRVYTHMVIAKNNSELDLSRVAPCARDEVRINFDYYVRQAGPNPSYPEQLKPADKERYSEIASMGREGYTRHLIQKRTAAIEKGKADGHYSTFNDHGWCGRSDLAQKLAAKLAKDGYLEVTIVPVSA